MGEIGFTDLPKLRPSLSQKALDSIDKLLQPPEGTPKRRVLRLMHRVAVFVAAILCVMISLESFSTAVVILRGQVSRDLPLEILTASLITGYVGTATIKESPLVQQVLEGSTTPRNYSLYLETPSAQSHTGCSNVARYNSGIYSNTYLRFIFSRLQAYASYNLSYVTELELVVPVVDCTFELLVLGDPTVLRVYYLAREKSDPEQVLLLSTSLSVQDYQVEQQFQRGAGTALLVAAINDTQATTLEHHIAVALNYPYVAEPEFAYSELEGIDGDNYWLLKTLPNQRNLDPAKEVRLARRFGRYRGDPTAQSNIETAHWDLPSDPTTELQEWRWYGRAVLHDSWAWTHAIHGVFALNDIFNLSVLAFVIYRRFCMGHVWVGDAFATISNMLLYRGVIVLICSHLNGYWTITKMCISIGDSITGQHIIYYRPELVHADLLSVYLNLASVLSYLVRERVDPLVAFLTFELGWMCRLELANLFPALAKHITDFAVADATLGLLDVSPGLARLSPIELLTAYPLESDRKPVVFSAVLSICSPIVLMLAYIAGRKSTRYASVPVTMASEQGASTVRRRSDAHRRGFEQNGLTSFEVATGAALVKRFGVISSYDNYVAHDKQLIASIDAVYGNGFLVANGKFLVGARDLLPLIVMKLTRVRFTNIFVYEIMENYLVNETSTLVYPTTIAWSDLLRLDVTTLA
ncbi:putative transmembrane protein [Phytophthora cinnamomi]|uniref:putative transmembrane protein n=1 Tax=Phytophthora cinnamomi TaxID=4785 RepID=UPI00355949A5|nr:putative transmembrane protein [Phytophthora cinnamomi]